MIWFFVGLMCMVLTCICARENHYASGAGEEFDTAALFAIAFVATVVVAILFANHAHLPFIGDLSLVWGYITYAICFVLVIVIFAIMVSRPPFNRRQRFPTHIETMAQLYTEHGPEAVGAYADIMRTGKRPWR